MRKDDCMCQPIDGLRFWVTQDQLQREKERADEAEARYALLERTLTRIREVDAAFTQESTVAEWHRAILDIKSMAGNSLSAARFTVSAEAEPRRGCTMMQRPASPLS
jgi:hypothetical protein